MPYLVMGALGAQMLPFTSHRHESLIVAVVVKRKSMFQYMIPLQLLVLALFANVRVLM